MVLLSRRHMASFPHRRYSFPLLHLSLNPLFQSTLEFFPLTPLQKARKTLLSLLRGKGKCYLLLSFWKIKQVLALHPAVNGYVVDLFDSKTDSMTALRSLLSSLRKTYPCFICSILHSTQPCCLGLISPLPLHTL